MNRLVNTTVLSNFAATQALDLLRDTAGPLYLPNEVYDEIAAGQCNCPGCKIDRSRSQCVTDGNDCEGSLSVTRE